MLLAPGTVIADRYEVVRLAERGGMALLYLVRHRDLQQPLALKVLRTTREIDPMAADYFASEARSVSATWTCRRSACWCWTIFWTRARRWRRG